MSIEKLIKAAPDVPAPGFDTTGIDRELSKVWKEYQDFPKVRHKTYTLLNCKQVLSAFRKKRTYAPKKPKRAAGTKRLNKRTLYEDVNYRGIYTPRKVTKLPEFMVDAEHAGYYVDGFYSNKHFMVKIDKPKTKRPLDCELGRMSDMIKEATVNVGEPVAVSEETFDGARGGAYPHAHFYGVKIHVIIDARHLDIIYKHYPDTRAYRIDAQINFFVKEELVGIISLIRRD